MTRAITGLAAVLLGATAVAGEITFLEDFALSRDRAAALRQLIPGTEDYYYYHALHALNTEQFERVPQFTAPWFQRHGRTPRLVEIESRYHLLAYDRDPAKSLAYLRERLGLRFDHQRETPGAVPDLPVRLDPNLIARDRLKADSLARGSNLENYEDSALDWLAAADLDWERRRTLLQRLARPDVANLPKLVDADLRSPHAPPFGSYPVHRALTLAQLAELVRLRPQLLNEPPLVTTWVAKLRPGADSDWRRDKAEARAYLARLEEFVGRLAPAHNALKAHVLYHRLALDRSAGTYDKARFLAYLALPRRQSYIARALAEKRESQLYPADLTADFSPSTLLPPVGPDEPLVRDYLKHFLTDAPSTAEFEPFIDGTYLRHLFAEAKVEAGLGDPEQWASQLPPEVFRQLRERVDIDFAPTNKTEFAADESVSLELSVKNVPNLIVKVFEVNALNYYRTTLKEVDTALNLDGLVPNAERSLTSAESPLRRVARRVDLPELARPGVYVVDFIGSGKSSRALVRKGRLRPVVRGTTAGLKVAVFDEANKRVTDAAVWLGGREYGPDKDGTVTVPYSTEPARRPVVLSRGAFASLDAIDHKAEQYRLTAGLHVDRETLLTSRVAPLVVRPGLFLNDEAVTVKLLESVKLTVVATDQGGVQTSVEVPDFKLFEDRESVHEFRVPPRLASLQITLSAAVKSLTLGKPVDLSASASFALNGIAQTHRTDAAHLAKFGGDYVVELLGRTGEPVPDRPVPVILKHRDFREPVRTVLKTDARGRITLGPLPDVTSVAASGPEGREQTWPLPGDRAATRRLVHARAGEPVTVPYAGGATRDELALFEVVGDTIRADRFDALAARDGALELKGLAAGDYDLWLKRAGERVRVRVVEGPAAAGFVLGQVRDLELPPLKPVRVREVTADGDHLTVRVGDASKFARVHVFATRYHPEYGAYENLGRVRAPELTGTHPARASSVYLTGRDIGDEYRYVLDRRGVRKFPGNMLPRPELLLNPWAVRSTETGEQEARGGEDFRRKGEGAGAVPAPASPPWSAAGGKSAGSDFVDLDFLADPTAVLLNLVPDADGVVRVPRKVLGPHALVRVVAVDPLHTAERWLSLPEEPAKFADLRLRNGLDPAKHFVPRRQASVLAAGRPFVIADVAGGRFEVYDSLAEVYALYATLSKDPKLAEFAFVTAWPKLDAARKRELYSKHACHELNFFLSRKDPAFFEEVVKPFLANKKDRTFLDDLLTGAEVGGHLKPWEYGRLNAAERVFLSRRVPGEPPRTARHLGDLLRLVPPNPEREQLLFDTALKGNDLGLDDALGVRKLKEALERRPELQTEALMEKDMPNAPAGAAPGAPRPADEPAERAKGESKLKSDVLRQEEAKKQLRARDGRGLKDADKSFENGHAEYFHDNDRLGRVVRQLYRRIDPTMEWAENNYYRLPITAQTAELIAVGPFWVDYARHDGNGPFLSEHFVGASRNFTEMMLALSVLDLPFEAGKHETRFADGGMTLTPASPAVAFHEEVRPSAGKAQSPVLVSQNVYRHNDRFREEGGERLDKFVTGEFVAGTVYGCQIVVTNPSSARQKLSALVQIPAGAVPVAGGQNTRTLTVDLEPFRTQTIDYFFYFPLPGRFGQFPVHVAKGEALVAAAEPTAYEVVGKPSRLDTGSWEYVSQNGTTEDVLAFLGRGNVHALDLTKLAFRMKDRAAFEAVLRLLQERHAFDQTLWSYALLHADAPAARQYLAHANGFVAELGGPVTSPLLTTDPVARHEYEHLEYKPLVHARAHALGRRRQIVNDRLYEQYHRFLKVLSYRRDPNDADRLEAAYYLLVQDRVEEALAAFAAVDPAKVPTRLQYDYCAAYLAAYQENPQEARSIALRHANHPVDRWRDAFAAVAAQMDEAEGKAPPAGPSDDRERRQGQLAATEPAFELRLDGGSLHLNWQNLDAVTVNYYLMDVELLFSRNPFVQQGGRQFAFIKPNASARLPLPAGKSALAVPLPAEFANRNVLVEVTAAGKARSQPHYATAVDVKLAEGYGEVSVTGGGRPVPKAYVKVYAKLADGTVKFHKDGYTDLRGRFDYATVSTPERSPVERFAVLVLTDDRGATIREAAPPQR